MDKSLKLAQKSQIHITDNCSSHAKDPASKCTTIVSKKAPSWESIFDDLTREESPDISTEMLVNAAIYSISAVEALEQMQTKTGPTPVITTAKKGCYSCGGTLRTKDHVLICQNCGLEIQGAVVAANEDESTTSSQDANVNDKGFISMKIVGKGSYGYNRNLLKNCADYPRYRKMTTLKEMHNWNSQSTNNQLPKNVIEEANEMFAAIKEHNYVFRKDVKKGVQGACLYYTCHLNGISRTPTEIAKIIGIAEKFLSAGDRHLRDLNERGIITIPARVDAVTSYVNRYFELLKIPEKYKPFVIDMIRQADEYKLHVQYDSKSNTKCIGTIYMLIDRIPELRKNIDKDRIEKECEISKTTFIKYYMMLCRFYRCFVHLFVKHKIPMKSEWRDNLIPGLNFTKDDTDVATGQTGKKKKVKKYKKQQTKETDGDTGLHDENGNSEENNDEPNDSANLEDDAHPNDTKDLNSLNNTDDTKDLDSLNNTDDTKDLNSLNNTDDTKDLNSLNNTDDTKDLNSPKSTNKQAIKAKPKRRAKPAPKRKNIKVKDELDELIAMELAAPIQLENTIIKQKMNARKYTRLVPGVKKTSITENDVDA